MWARKKLFCGYLYSYQFSASPLVLCHVLAVNMKAPRKQNEKCTGSSGMINKYASSQNESFFNAFFQSFCHNCFSLNSWMAIFGVIVASDIGAAVAKGFQQKISTQRKAAPQEIDKFCLRDDECWWRQCWDSVWIGAIWSPCPGDSGCHCNIAGPQHPQHRLRHPRLDHRESQPWGWQCAVARFRNIF